MNDAGELTHVDVFIGGVDGVHTYRIPSLLVAPGGTLLAFCEARKIGSGDASPTDMVLKRSLDGGQTWLPMQVLVRGDGDEAIMNPCPLVDGSTILLFCMNAHKKARNHHRHLLLTSGDDGQTWSEPRVLDECIAAYDDTFVPGPGVAIRTRGGRLVVPGYTNVIDADGGRPASFSRVVYSDDGGRSWRLGQPVVSATSNESQVVELADGSLLLNWREQNHLDRTAHRGCRGTAVSRDGGETWSEPVFALELNEAPCQAGFVRGTLAADGDRNRLLFSNPDAVPGPDGGERTKMTVRMSYDEGRTWPVARLIHAGPTAYSCPAMLPAGDIGLLYEGGEQGRYERIRLARFSLVWLTGEKPVGSGFAGLGTVSN
jgi:sialidase-1